MILSRVRLLPQQRYDLEDFYADASAGRTDSKLWTKEVLTDENCILKGFTVTGLGFNQATVVVNRGTLFIPQNTSDFSWFTVAPGAANITIPDSALVDGARNYVELKLVTKTGTPIVKSFWDPSANGGQGAEFNQLIDTMFDLDVEVEVSTGGFSGSGDRLPLAIIDVNNAGVIRVILDRRKLFFRLGTPSDIDEGFTWASQQEPGYQMVLSGVTGTFQPGETLSIGSETAELVSGTTSPLVFRAPSGISFGNNSSVVGQTSGATGTVSSIYESFDGADKDIDNQREMNRALQTELRAVKGTRFWYQNPGKSLAEINKTINLDRFMYIRSDDTVEWSGTALVFPEDIILELIDSATDTVTTHTIETADSPISIGDGEFIYVMVDKSQSSEVLTVYNSGTTPLSSQDLVAKEAIILFRRIDNPLTGSNELYLPFSKQFINEGQVFRIGASGSGGSGGFKVTAYDPLNASLPTGTSVIVDGVTLVNGDTVLFSNLSSGNNQVYELSGVGVSLVWTPVRAFQDGSFTAVDGDKVFILEGNAFADQTANFNGTEFTVNDVVRYFNGADYWQYESLKTTQLDDAQPTEQDIFTVQATGSENLVVDFSLKRGTYKETGSLYITHDGTNVSLARTGTSVGALSGIEFSADINTGDLRLRYTSESTGFDADFKFIIKRWSDSSGGPAGVPSYASSGGAPISAGGSDTHVQFNDGGNLNGEAAFSWNKTSKTLRLSDMYVTGISSPITLNDNQVVPATFLIIDSTTFKHAIIGYSAEIAGVRRTGRLLVASDGTTAVLSDDYVETSGSGLNVIAVQSGSDILCQYTTGMTGSAGSLKLTIQKWI